MARKKKQLPLLQSIPIVDVAAEGKALARVDGMPVFVPYVVPGDVVDVQLLRKKRGYAEGRAVAFHSYSDEREEPFCSHFGICGGCKWQLLPYERQLEYKRRQVTDHLTRIGKIEIPEVTPTIGSRNTTYYRNKLEFTFSNNAWLTSEQIESGIVPEHRNALGFHIPGRFDKVLDIDTCYLQSQLSNRIRVEIRNFCLSEKYPFFDLRKQDGLMRNIIIRTASTGEIMLIVVFFRYEKEKCEKLLEYITKTFPEITSLLYVINEKANDTISDQKIHKWSGKDYITETMEDLRFKIGPKSFYQTNSTQAYRLYCVAREMAQLSGNECVYDLYTGVGTIATFVARHAQKVIGIEFVPEAIEDAKENARHNGINNTFFFVGDMRKILTKEFIDTHGRADVVITDPPRSGMHPDVVQALLESETPRIVYVSCNSATQARDIALMDEQYRVAAVQPVDMFPHTHHVENVVLLERR